MAKNNIIKWRLCPLIMKYVLSQLNRDAEIKTGNSQYRLCHMVGLIKRTCLELLDGKFDIENTHTYGKFKVI